MDTQQLTKLVGMFKTEAAEHITAINQALLTLERVGVHSDSGGHLEQVFRDAHSLKGAARTVGFKQVETLAHQMESILGAAKAQQLELTPKVCDLLYKTLDLVEKLLEQPPETVLPEGETLQQALYGLLPAEYLAETAPAPQPIPEEPKPIERNAAQVADRTIRVNVAKLESLMAQASELLVFKITAEQRLVDLKKIRLDLKKHRLAHRKRGSSSRTNEAPINVEGLLEDVTTRLSILEHSLANDMLRLGLVVENVQDDIRQTRMMPLSTALGGFMRLVRDLAHSLQKEVRLEVTGDQIEVDRQILEEIRDPLMHLLRNAVDHGIELPATREALGKPREGLIQLIFQQQGNNILVTIQDDGQGIDAEAVKHAALKAGFITAKDLDNLSIVDILHLSLLPGISTSRQITNVSGRGVGLDVVRHKVETLHGHITIHSHHHQGTVFQLTVPLTVATTHGLLVRVGTESYALPITAISKIVTFRAKDVRMVNGRETIPVQKQATALIRLADVLDVPVEEGLPEGLLKAVLLKSGEYQVAFMVDELLGEQEMVIKTLGDQLERVRNVSGATLLGTGEVVIILNTAELLRSAQNLTHHQTFIANPALQTQRTMTILVVDDSITTRTLEKNILEAEGYQVVTAMDGTDALRYLQANTCDLVVSDIQMPKMDGIELTKAIRSNTNWNHLPLILVTSLESPIDKERGLSAGADAYIFKSGFDQDDLLTTIKRLV